jgi:hypothetical protein
MHCQSVLFVRITKYMCLLYITTSCATIVGLPIRLVLRFQVELVHFYTSIHAYYTNDYIYLVSYLSITHLQAAAPLP